MEKNLMKRQEIKLYGKSIGGRNASNGGKNQLRTPTGKRQIKRRNTQSNEEQKQWRAKEMDAEKKNENQR